MSAHEWTLGGLDLVNAEVHDGDGYWFETLADGLDLGSPEASRVVLETLAADGDDERILRHGNRTVSFVVRVVGVDSAAMHDGCRALALEIANPSTLTWLPPDGLAEASVFDIRTATHRALFDDFDLIPKSDGQVSCSFEVSLSCEPFARPVDPTTVTLTYGTATSGTTLDDGSSTTGWSALEPSGVGVSTATYLGEAAIRVGPYSRGPGNLTWRAQRASLALTAARPFLAVDVAEDASDSYLGTVWARFNGGDYVESVAVEPQSNGYVRHFFQHALAGTTATVELRVVMTSWIGGSAESLFVGGLHSYASAPAAGLLIVPVEGSQRAPFSLRLSRGSSTLNRVFVFADPAMLEFGYNPGVSTTWEFAPAGTYTVAIPATGVAGKTYVLTINGQSSTTRALTTGETLWFEFHLGATRNGRVGALTTALTEDGATISVPATTRLFRNAAETSLVALGSVSAANVFIDSPTLESPSVGLWAGASSDGSGATSVASLATCADPLHLIPPMTPLYVSQSGTADVLTAEVTYYSRHHTFVSQGS